MSELISEISNDQPCEVENIHYNYDEDVIAIKLLKKEIEDRDAKELQDRKSESRTTFIQKFVSRFKSPRV